MIFLGASFRISSANEYLARHSVRRTLANRLMPNTDTFNSNNTAKRHIEQQMDQHNDHISMDQYNEQSLEYSLDYETGLLKTSSVSCTSSPVFADSNKNGNTNGMSS